MLAKLRAIAQQTDMTTLLAVAVVGWGLTHLGKALAERQDSVAALTNKAAQVAGELAQREQELAHANAQLAAIRAQARAEATYPTVEDVDPLATGEN
ncbi:hypothetical protein GCM10009765_65110 [Fodinicola feengrottensis]|uniref:Uncharacterized protein n=2 Tax=Fodinicola feengrottensis TaxID=435914 RepID=A0ABN2IK68_9ACTN